MSGIEGHSSFFTNNDDNGGDGDDSSGTSTSTSTGEKMSATDIRMIWPWMKRVIMLMSRAGSNRGKGNGHGNESVRDRRSKTIGLTENLKYSSPSTTMTGRWVNCMFGCNWRRLHIK